MDRIAALEGVSPAFVESLYSQYQSNPDSIDAGWRDYFNALETSIEAAGPSWARSDWPLRPNDDLTTGLDGSDMFIENDKPVSKGGAGLSEEDIRAATIDSIRALMMVRTYRVRGHLMANLDPLGLEDRPTHAELEPDTYGFGPDDRNRPIFMDGVLGLKTATINEIIEILRRTYCSNLGVEFMHINDPEEKAWLQRKIEGRDKEIQFTDKGKIAILNKLIEAEHFEKFLGRKYTGTKRFGLDGGESMVPALEGVMKTGGQFGLEEIVLGMPHRGRLNVLANVMQKPYRAIFNEFHGGSFKPDDVQGSGDVKYHLGTSADREFDGNKIHLSLNANPSHLEAVNPVVIGKVHAKQFQKKDAEHAKVLPILLHGDAAFAGQGIVAECFAMSGVRGYNSGGTIHFIVNNQIGFTTSPQFARSSPYPSDVAKMVQAPIFHVNGDDPESVVFATKVATEFRQTFKRDVVIDMICYRRFGHNESDEPAFTQPLMYAAIKKHPSVVKLYGERLIAEGLITDETFAQMQNEFVSYLEDEFEAGRDYRVNKADWFEGKWEGLGLADEDHEKRRAQTGVAETMLREVGEVLTHVPETFNSHRTLKRVLDNKDKMFETGAGFDWATAEALAFGTLLKEGYDVRLSGQDCGRGTFSQRHAVFVDQKTEERYVPLQHVEEDRHFEVLDSPLSEYGVLGFEYGYSTTEPNTLTLWEAQFGDFANGAQIIIDQFICSAEAKWLRLSGLVMLLPHGYEGQGPEHSSARLERYLQLSAEDNWQVANCTTPANYFHILRRQMHRKFRKPLIMMTPKSLLRHKKAVSKLEEFGPGSQFHRVLWDDAEYGGGSSIKLKSDDKIKRVVMCSGKVYFDLLDERDKRGQDDTYLLRVEQLYPFPQAAVAKELARFKNLETVVWCQEEPKNMGSWAYINEPIEGVLADLDLKPKRAVYAGRTASASTATGLASRHVAEQEALVDQALTA
ncbi:2-oxoglutarate dehydrogenase E1 component [Kordiimonas sp. SCSIO 12610]|uniref:2-oxoglutarate dehydrogenase E1 component n=1 Tax=Kordiimonas sp. SCSIO 12610 TaxID=2829597 RepID=UPI00210BF797|nr:2-oxoglutarate dehydrogenase E1 component [Kordiimonas sp. SCSIO 12610]